MWQFPKFKTGKRNNKYQIPPKELGGKDDAEANPSLGFDLANHNALFHIFNLIRDKNLFGKVVTDLEFAVGCNLFTKVIIRQKYHPLFEALRPQILELIEDLRSSSMEYKIIEL